MFDKIIQKSIFLTLALFSMGQFGRISFLNQEINAYYYEIAIALTLLLLVFKHHFKPLHYLYKHFFWILAFLGYMTASFTISTFYYSPIANGIASLYLLRLWLHVIYFGYCAHYCLQLKYHSFLNRGIYVFILITVISSFAQYFFFQDLNVLFYDGWDPHLYRMFGLFLDPPISASIYAMILTFLLVNPHNVISAQYIRYTTVVGYVIALFLTYSRGGYVAAIITLSVCMMRTSKMIIFAACLIIFLGVFFLLPKKAGEGVNLLRTSTIESRTKDYQEGIRVWLKSPIIGIGYNHIRYEKNQAIELSGVASHSGASLHSSFLIVLATGGIIGLILYVIMLYHIAKQNELMSISIIFLSVISLFDNVLLHPFILFSLFTWMTISIIRPSDT